MRRFIPLFIALASLTSAAQAAPIGVAQVKVSSAGLDLSTEAGAAKFLKQLSRAATYVCGEYPDPSPLAPNARDDFYLCRAKALAAAVAQSASPVLQRQFAETSAARLVRMAAR